MVRGYGLHSLVLSFHKDVEFLVSFIAQRFAIKGVVESLNFLYGQICLPIAQAISL